MKKTIISFILSCLVLLVFTGTGQSTVDFVGGFPYGNFEVVAIDETGNLAFVPTGQWISVLDISNPAVPKRVGKVILPGNIRDVFFANDFLYVTQDQEGLWIFDMSDPSDPLEAGYLGTRYPRGVYVSGTYAYVASTSLGLRIIDVSDPASPFEAGFIDTPDIAREVYVSGSYAYVADYQSGLRIIDVSEASNPVKTGFADTPGFAEDVYISGSHAIVADNTTGVRIIDVSKPANPFEAAVYEPPGYSYGVFAQNNRAYVAVGGSSLVPDNNSGLRIFDITDPTKPSDVGFFETPGVGRNVRVSGDHAFVANWDKGLRVIDVSDLNNLSESGFYNTPVQAVDIFLSGSHAYVAGYHDGLQIFDVSDPSNPIKIGFYEDIRGAANDVFVSGNLALLAEGSSGLRLLDVSDPSNPFKTDFIGTPGNAYGVHGSGSLAYVADGGYGLRIIDVSNPVNPIEIGSFDTPGESRDVFVSGLLAYVADDDGGLRIIDVSDPANPFETGSLTVLDNRFWDIHVSGDYAYVADRFEGLRIIDVSDPANSFETASLATPKQVEGVFVSGSYAYMAANDAGVRIIDVSDPENPYETDFHELPLAASKVDVSGFMIYIASDDGGLQIYEHISAGIIDVRPTGVSVAEGSQTGSFTVRLGSQPRADVIIDLVNTRPTECRLSRDSVTLTDLNWEKGVEVTVSAVDDALADGKQSASIILKPAASNDLEYHEFNPENVKVTIEDDETEVKIFSVYPAYGISGDDLAITVEGINFVPGTTRLFISDYPGGGNETELTGVAVESETTITLTVPGQTAGEYNLKAVNGSDIDILENAITFSDSATVENQKKKKAIIVAGGGDHPDNDLWYASRNLGDLAYFALYSQGYTDESIYYLRDGSSDVNGDGKNDVDDGTTTDNLLYAIQDWAMEVPVADDLLIYLTGQGTNETFWINYTRGDMVAVSAQTLDTWLDSLNLSGNVVVIYDACRSGSFPPVLAEPGRVVITGTSADERAWFLDEGEISFSSFFWNSIFYKASVTRAFTDAKTGIGSFQSPLMDDDGDGNTDWRPVLRADPVGEVILGRKRSVDYQLPVIEDVSTDPLTLNGSNSAAISAGKVIDTNGVGISTVWSRILMPFDDLQASHIPVIAVPTVKLEDPDADDFYEKPFDSFIYRGTYDIFAHMEDKAGYFSVPVFTGVTRSDGIVAETGDVNLDETVDLKDLVVALKVFSNVFGRTGYPVDFAAAGLDINGDKQMGMEEILFILGKTAQLR